MLKGNVLLTTMLSAILAVSAGAAFIIIGAKRTFHLTGFTSAGAGAATVLLEGSNDGTNWVTLDTLVLTLGTVVTSDFFVLDAPWKWVRGNVTVISGTDAQVTLTAGGEVLV